MEETLKEKCIRLEHFETPEWAARAILEKEELDDFVLDPCCGTGVLTNAAFESGRHVRCMDIHNWGYKYQHETSDFLKLDKFDLKPFSVFMNPPFSKACEFVEKSFELGARKILCFQRFAWWESAKRRNFWDKHPPSKVYICGDRAACWRHDISKEDRESSSPTAHAWFVWDREYEGPTVLSHIWKY